MFGLDFYVSKDIQTRKFEVYSNVLVMLQCGL